MTNDDSNGSADFGSSEKPRATPTTIRLTKDQLEGLDEVARQSRLPRSSLISLGVDALIDHVKRTGKLLLPQKRSRTRNHGS